MSAEPASAGAAPRWELRLFVAGHTPLSAGAIACARAFCEAHLAGDYRLTVVDLYQQAALAEAAQIVAVPTLLKLLPPPLQRLVGDLSDAERLRAAFGLDAPPAPAGDHA